GQALPNYALYILDRFGQLVAPGVAGELHIGGAGLARGYLNRDDLSAEKFIANPFADVPGASERIYKTGDLVRLAVDGKLEYLGRIDNQVKLRGFRIELGEIENALSALPQVKAAVVQMRKGAGADHRLVAWAQLTDAAVADMAAKALSQEELAQQLRAALAQSLPDFMLPAALMLLPQWPLTPNGKIDHKALPEPVLAVSRHALTAARDTFEAQLCQFWQEVLGLEQVGVEDNFFALGGHSLLATRVVARINQHFGIRLPLRQMFEAQTLAQLAQAVNAEVVRSSGLPAQPPMLPMTAEQRQQPLLPSFGQQRLWLLDRIDGGSSHYNMPSALRLDGVLDQAALQQTVVHLLQRHEVLRTCIREGSDGQPVQWIMDVPAEATPRFSRLFSVSDVSALAEGPQELAMQTILNEEAQHVFDLTQDDMLRVKLIRLAPQQHVLSLTMHHIASDGWSITILVQELVQLYQAFHAGLPDALATLPPLPLQYADYAHWQRAWLEGEVLAQQLAYWQTKLAGLPALHQLPLDFPRPPVVGYVGAMHESRIDATTSSTLKALCQQHGATLFMGVHAAFSVLLARFSNETDIVIGTPVANREQAEIAGLIGFFVNTLVLRADLSGKPGFAELVQQSRSTLLEAYAHQQVPFEQIVDRLQPVRSQSHSPLFQIMLSMQDLAEDEFTLPGLELSAVGADAVVAKYDLTLNVGEQQGSLMLAWNYNPELFAAASIERMAAHFAHLLQSMVARPQENVFCSNMFSEAQYQQCRQLKRDWYANHQLETQHLCLHELLEAQVARQPEALALIWQQQQLSYGQLNQRANQLAHYLRARRQIAPEALVGVCMQRSPEMVIAILAVLKAGAAYVPLDPAYPAARLAYMVADASLQTVLTQAELLEPCGFGSGQAVALDDPDLQHQLQNYPDTNMAVQDSTVTAQHLAYVIYTSGSTGNPKGVMIEHRNAVAFLAWASRAFSRAQLSCVLASTSVCFDLSIFEMFAPLSNGGSALIVKNILELQADMPVTLINTVPSAAEALLAGTSLPASARTINLAGEPLRQSVVDALYQKGLQYVYDLYGPSEDTTYSTWVLRQAKGRASIGQPIDNTEAWVVNAHDQLVPQGVAGELLLGGAGLARGYLNRPDLTAEKFIANPFYDASVAGSSARLYRTADLVRWLPDGNLEYLGRIDHQVKIRGFRIELGEIEAALLRQSGIKDAVVVARQATSGDKQLVAYVVTAAGVTTGGEGADGEAAGGPDSNPDLAVQLRKGLGASLPDFMLPAIFVRLASLPLTPNGKVDRKALPAPEMAASEHAKTAPRDHVEAQLCQFWQEVLGLEQVGVDDNFFALGGHSLLATRVVARINQHFGINLPLRQMFEAQTLAQLAQAVQAGVVQSNGMPVPPPMLPMSPEQRQQPLLPSFGQQRLWLLDRIDGGSSHYNMPGGMSLQGPLQVAALQQAVTVIVQRHESLRTSFAVGEQGQP
ncbi:MAG: hypothetical protein RL748_1548, partial [Pseudomonadota bacterium]